MGARAMLTAASGMQAQDTRIDVISNNLANTNTTAFKASRANFQDLFYQELRRVGTTATRDTRIPTGIQVGMGVEIAGTQRMHAQGNLSQTESPFHVAINGPGFFRVVIDEEGTIGYTRDGSFTVDSESGNLVTQDGFPLADAISIPNNTDPARFSIAPNGVVEVTLPGAAAPQQIGEIQVAEFLNREGLLAVGKNLFVETEASGEPRLANPREDGMGELRQGYLEESNVELVIELVQMIRAQRAFEINSEAIQATDEMMQTVGQLRR